MPRDERQTRIELINPVLYERGWVDSLIREEKTPGGTDIIDGKPVKRRGRTDYLLCIPAIEGKSPLAVAVIEAKSEDKLPSLGIQQAKDYMKKFNVPFAFSTNGNLYTEYGKDTGQIKDSLYLSGFPTPEELKKRYEEINSFKLGGKTGIADIVNGSTPSTDTPEYWGGGILWATPSDLGNSHSIYIENTERKITKAGLESCSTTLVPIGAVLLTSRAPAGNLAIAKKPICTNQGFKSFIPRDGVNSLYLYFAIKKIVPKIQKASHGNTFTEITKESVQDFKIPLSPTLDDQIRIASKLERKMVEIETMRQAAEQQLEAIEALPGAILREVFDFEEDN